MNIGLFAGPFRRAPALVLVAIGLLAAFAARANAAVPSVMLVEGALTSGAGGPVADGQYPITFSLYPSESGGAAAWTEGPVLIPVSSGQFSYEVGSKKPLDATVIGNAWLSIQLGSDPPMGRKHLQSVPFSIRAGLAEGLACTGCVTEDQISAKVLAPYAILEELASVAMTGEYVDLYGIPDLDVYAKIASLAKVATTGAYPDLKGQPDLSVFAKIANLAKVATSGSYGDLSDKPDFSPYAKSASLAAVATSGAYGDISGTPDLSPYVTAASLAAVATSGAYGDISGTPDLSPYATTASLSVYAKIANLATVATTGSYGSLSGVPDLSVYAKIANLASVATTGAYSSLSGTPNLALYATVASLSSYATTASLAAVATTGAYSSLSGRPVIPVVGQVCAAPLVLRGINADGTYNCVDGTVGASNGVPSGAVMAFNLTVCPTGWSELSTAWGRTIVGRPSGGSVGLAVGVALANGENRNVAGPHTHTYSDPGHVHYYTDTYASLMRAVYSVASVSVYYATTTVGKNTNAAGVGITINSAGSAGTNSPYLQLLYCQKN